MCCIKGNDGSSSGTCFLYARSYAGFSTCNELQDSYKKTNPLYNLGIFSWFPYTRIYYMLQYKP